jgi:hypothetical protein
MFRDDKQRAAVCNRILELARLPPGWVNGEATKTIVRWRTSSPHSSGERVMIALAWTVWNGDMIAERRLALAEVIDHLDNERLADVGMLLLAIAGGAKSIDRWLVETAPAPADDDGAEVIQ